MCDLDTEVGDVEQTLVPHRGFHLHFLVASDPDWFFFSMCLLASIFLPLNVTLLPLLSLLL